jgi:LPS-assembly protein
LQFDLFYCPRLMSRIPAIALLVFFAMALPFISSGEDTSGYTYKSLSDIIPGAPEGSVGYDLAGDIVGTNIIIMHDGASLMADTVSFNQQTGWAIARGHVCIERNDQLWTGDHVTYNLNTHEMETGEFRSGKAPIFIQGEHVQGNVTNHTYMARDVYATTDNVHRPAYYIQASRMKIVPGQYIEAWNGVLYVEGVPLFYFPYYRHELGPHQTSLTVMPGDDSLFGPYLLSTYTWRLSDHVEGKIHLDYRERRGIGAGPDLALHMGRWGDLETKYYYLHDMQANLSITTNAFQNLQNIGRDRQRLYFGWQATPETNFNTKALVNYQSDQLVLHDYFQSDYGENPQPNTFVEANKYWDNWSFDAETTPRVNDFFDQVQRLPDLQLTGFRQQIFNTPIYYESQSSVGYYDKFFADTNTLFGLTNGPFGGYSAMRADTFHQLLLPETFFDWLNVTPRVGGRATYYGSEGGSAGTNSASTRLVFNTGADVSFKASQLWPDATNSLLQIDGLRHIIEPSLSYVYVPGPHVTAPEIPQFDSQLPSLMVLPVEFPDYDDIDAIRSENVIRFGLGKILQTKRDGDLQDLLNWNVMLDWNLRPSEETNAIFPLQQKTFDDLYSSLTFRPRSWIILESKIRYDINDDRLNLAFHQITFTPSDRWSWSIGHWYLHNGFVDTGDDVITSSFYYRLDENWGLRTTHYFNALTGRLQEQYYSVYRDMRSFTCAVTLRFIDNGGGQPLDYGFAFSISLKASPRYRVGEDAVRPYDMLGQ